MFDDYLNDEFGILALHLTNEGLDDRNKDIPYFHHEQLADPLKTTAASTILPPSSASPTQVYEYTRARTSPSTPIITFAFTIVSSTAAAPTVTPERPTTTTRVSPPPFQVIIDFHNFDAPLERCHRPQDVLYHPTSVPTIIPPETPLSRAILVFNVPLRHTFYNICVRQYLNTQRIHALSLIDPTWTARILLNRTDVSAILQDNLLKVTKCKPVNSTVIFTDHKVKGTCFSLLPLEIDGNLWFSLPNS